METKNSQSNNPLLQYAGLSSEILAGLMLAVYVGLWIDGKTKLHLHLAVWIFPLVVLLALFVKIIKDTSSKKQLCNHLF